jgi:hypothetical protein
MAAQAIWASEVHVVNHNASFQIEDAASANVALHSDELYGIGLPRIAGNSDALRRVLDMVRVVAPTDATVLINGETADQGIENQQAPIQIRQKCIQGSDSRNSRNSRDSRTRDPAIYRSLLLFSQTWKWQEPCSFLDRSRHGSRCKQIGEQ